MASCSKDYITSGLTCSRDPTLVVEPSENESCRICMLEKREALTTHIIREGPACGTEQSLCMQAVVNLHSEEAVSTKWHKAGTAVPGSRITDTISMQDQTKNSNNTIQKMFAEGLPGFWFR